MGDRGREAGEKKGAGGKGRGGGAMLSHRREEHRVAAAKFSTSPPSLSSVISEPSRGFVDRDGNKTQIMANRSGFDRLDGVINTLI